MLAMSFWMGLTRQQYTIRSMVKGNQLFVEHAGSRLFEALIRVGISQDRFAERAHDPREGQGKEALIPAAEPDGWAR